MTTIEVPPEAQPTDYHRGQIFALTTGVTVCLVRSISNDSWETVVVESSHPNYPVGGYNIVVSDAEIKSEGIEKKTEAAVIRVTTPPTQAYTHLRNLVGQMLCGYHGKCNHTTTDFYTAMTALRTLVFPNGIE